MGDEIGEVEAAIKDLDLDYMRGLVSEDEYQLRMAQLRSKLEAVGGKVEVLSSVADSSSTAGGETIAGQPSKAAMTDPVTAVKNVIHAFRRIPIERISQESGVNAPYVAKILSDLLDGRELSGHVDHDAGDFILGTGTGPAPKSISACPYCKNEQKRVAVRGETVTCGVCKESFIVT
ncbi:MAG: hypothetical protein JSW61_06850 [Candidatus Thorarchaeota archaeon]|nr:MAG: hypothetical protein JSW61_06850 [Candidatus Thorarchaeota archaeon]